MNRIKISPLATASSETKQPKISESLPSLEQLRKFQTAPDDHALFVPMHYEKKYAYPLLVWLHSNGDDSSQLLRVMPHTSIRNFLAIAPQAPYGNSHIGFHWEQVEDCIEDAQQGVMRAIDHVSMRFNIAPHRIFLAGAGAGATMAFRVAFQRPELFAGVVSLHGPLPEGGTPLADWSRARNLPVFWAHGRHSVDFDQEQLCRQLRLLHIAGFSVTLRQYPTSDELTPKCFSDVNHWVMEQIDTAIGT